jgi:hypothetical protein
LWSFTSSLRVFRSDSLSSSLCVFVSFIGDDV